MNSKTRDRHFLFLVVLSLLVAMASISDTSQASFFPSELGVRTGNSSEQITTTVWGAPFPIVIDKPDGGSIGAIDRRDIFSGGAFLADWLSWFVLTWLLSYFVPAFFRFLFRFAREFTKPTP